MKKKKYRSTISELLSAGLFLVIGFVLLVVLQRHYSTAMLLAGIVLALIGIIKISRFFTYQDKRAADVVSLLFGIVAILGSIVVFARIKPVLELGVIFIGGYILLSAILRFSTVRRLGKSTDQKMIIPIVLTAVEALCGIFSMSAKALMPEEMFRATGGALMLFGGLEIIIILMTAKARKTANKVN